MQKDNLIGQSSSFLNVLDHISLVAPLNKPVLIVGERGTGKELIAERLHFLSNRWDNPYLKLNCAAISDNLIESELFGHEQGAFTGANKKHAGRFESAHSGTLFLDELATTSFRIQEKLLRVIEYGEFERVGGSKTLEVDVRLIAATNEDLPSLAAKNQFRADLLDRLAFDVITLPPLRHRQEDIMILAEHFALKMTKELQRDFFPGFSEHAIQTLMNYPWPGNIRELKNVIERNVYQHPAEEQIDHLVLDPFESPFRPQRSYKEESVTKPTLSVSTSSSSSNEKSSNEQSVKPTSLKAEVQLDFPIDFKSYVTEREVDILKSALESNQFNQKKTAEALGLTYHQLRGYLKKYNLL
jgi:psp operon transcriptional activator